MQALIPLINATLFLLSWIVYIISYLISMLQSHWNSMRLPGGSWINKKARFSCCRLLLGTPRWCAFRQATLCCSTSLYGFFILNVGNRFSFIIFVACILVDLIEHNSRSLISMPNFNGWKKCCSIYSKSYGWAWVIFPI